jgi:hypothetical protein
MNASTTRLLLVSAVHTLTLPSSAGTKRTAGRAGVQHLMSAGAKKKQHLMSAGAKKKQHLMSAGARNK